MNQPLSTHDLGSDVLKQVEEGADVYDHENRKIGTVERVYLGGVDEEADALGRGPMTEGAAPSEGVTHWLFNPANVFEDDDDLPEVARSRLLRSGFIKIDTGILSRDLYASPDQIASAAGEGVILNVGADDLKYE